MATLEAARKTPVETVLKKPELLAPAGDRTCMVAAVENGADAVYFGVHGHNARARASNFELESLPEAMDLLHRRGVKGYVTLNTLVFPREWDEVGRIVRSVAEAGVDAAIVQDLGLARLIRGLCPDLEIHASTQMSVTSAESMRLAEELGCTRVILARELSVDEIARIRKAATLPVEVFVHGALCVAYSGQCLTSEALGGRSANRGECAQACRMPYEIVRDGELLDLGKTKYLLSPQDLAAFELVPKLMEIGVASLKIEGRLKTPEYVANITRHYREAIDQASATGKVELSPEAVREMELSFSRGFSRGFLDGNNHKILVRGDYSKKRGVFLGRVTSIVGKHVRLTTAAPVKPGDGVVFDGDDDQGIAEQGGRIYEVRSTRPRPTRDLAGSPSVVAGPVELGFGRGDIDTAKLRIGQNVWKTDDPDLTRRLRKTFEGGPKRKVRLDFEVEAAVGRPLRIKAAAGGRTAEIEAETPLAAALKQPSDAEQVRENLGRLGDTLFELGSCDVHLEGAPMVPKSLLNQLRRALIERIEAEPLSPLRSVADPEVVLQALRPAVPARATTPPRLTVMCRDAEQIRAAVDAGIDIIYAEFQDIRRYDRAVEAVAGRASLYIATPRIQKPGEANLFRHLAKFESSGLLIRNPGGMYHCLEHGIPFIADFSMNAANELTADYLLGLGAERFTASYDLSFDQLEDLLARVPGDRTEVVIHQRIPMFHMEHCVFCAFMSPGTDHTNCGRPCDVHDVRLRDRAGVEHPLTADVGCRNTLFNAVPQTAAEYLPRLIAAGAGYLRLEFLDDKPEAVRKTIGLYRDVLEGRREPKNLWRELKASNQYGVTRGSLTIIQ